VSSEEVGVKSRYRNKKPIITKERINLLTLCECLFDGIILNDIWSQVLEQRLPLHAFASK
jgi:hypothetical protein